MAKRTIKQQSLSLRVQDAERIRLKLVAHPNLNFKYEEISTNAGITSFTVKYDSRAGDYLFKELLILLAAKHEEEII